VVNTTASLLLAAARVIVARSRDPPARRSDSTPRPVAVPAGFAVVLIAVFVMVSSAATSQSSGFLMLRHGIAATAFLVNSGPLIVELGASLEVLFSMLVLVLLTTRSGARSAAPTWTTCWSSRL